MTREEMVAEVARLQEGALRARLADFPTPDLARALATLQKYAAITVFCMFGRLVEYGDNALADIGDET